MTARRDGPPTPIEFTETPTDGKSYPELYRNPDGTLVPRDGIHDGLRDEEPPQSPVVTGKFLDDFTALQIGMWQILDGLTFTTVNRLRLITDGVVDKNTFKLTRIFLDWPDSEDGAIPAPAVSIMSPQETELQLAGPLSGQQIYDSTADLYEPGTALKKLYDLQASLQVVGWFANKDERAAFRRGLIEAFSEPGDPRAGRRVTVHRYFDRVGRYDLMGITYEDTPDNARSKIWPLTARFNADIEAVSLVKLPAHIRPPRIRVNT